MTIAIAWTCLPFADLSPRRLYRLLALRSTVFVLEQDCVYLDADGDDEAGWMLLGESAQGRVLATARVLAPGVRYPEPSIGRVCTAPDARGTGLGRVLMRQAIAATETLFPGRSIRISAQAHLDRFYGSLGFDRVSDLYDEDGIPHVEMLRRAKVGPTAADRTAE